MNSNATLLSLADVRVLTRASIEISLGELKDIVNFSIQHGPTISLNRQLHRIDESIIPPVCWLAMMEFIDWGAGFVANDPGLNTRYLLADSNHVERLIHLIARQIESNSGQGEKQATLNRQARLPLVKPLRKHDDSHEPR